MIRSSLLLVCVFWLVACGPAKVVPPTGTSPTPEEAKTMLVGNWASVCTPQAGHHGTGDKTFWKCTFDFSADGKLVAKDNVYSDAECQNLKQITHLQWSYKVGGKHAVTLDTLEMDMKLEEMTLTFATQQAVDEANTGLAELGCTTKIELNTAFTASSLGACAEPALAKMREDLGIPAVGSTLFSIFKLDTSGAEPLYYHSGAADETKDGLTSSTRQEKVDATLSHRKVK